MAEPWVSDGRIRTATDALRNLANDPAQNEATIRGAVDSVLNQFSAEAYAPDWATYGEGGLEEARQSGATVIDKTA
jgi:hypothetical protein